MKGDARMTEGPIEKALKVEVVNIPSKPIITVVSPETGDSYRVFRRNTKLRITYPWKWTNDSGQAFDVHFRGTGGKFKGSIQIGGAGTISCDNGHYVFEPTVKDIHSGPVIFPGESISGTFSNSPQEDLVFFLVEK
jgi:hypothetical protein